MKTPLVSVVMIFLNAEKFMQEAVESVLAQTYSNWELTLVDDGSTDSSTGLAQEYASCYKDKIRYFEHDHHQNRGMSASRNLGIRQCRGSLIAFLDADDVFLPDKLERQVGILSAQPRAEMVYGNTLYWYGWTGRVEDRSLDRMRMVGVPPDRLYLPPVLLRGFLEDKVRTPPTCGVLIRRGAIEKVGGFEDDFTGMFEDQVFFYKLCLHTPVYVESGVCARYRQHPNSWSQLKRKSGEWHPANPLKPAHHAFYDWLEGYLYEQEIADSELRESLMKLTWPHRHPALYRFLAPLEQLVHRLGTIMPKIS